MHSGPIIETKKLSRHFGGLKALQEVDLAVERGSVHGIIGPNGSGKTTLFNVISGVLPATTGSVFLDGEDVSGLCASAISHKGLNRTFQQGRLFKTLTVLENTLAALVERGVPGILRKIAKSYIDMNEGRSLLEIGGLTHRSDVLAGALPYGQQRVLEIIRSFALRPNVLLLDEPFTGMNGDERQNLIALIKSIQASGTTIAIIEHNMPVMMELCDRFTVLSHGVKIASGIPADVIRDPLVIEAYLGREDSNA